MVPSIRNSRPRPVKGQAFDTTKSFSIFSALPHCSFPMVIWRSRRLTGRFKSRKPVRVFTAIDDSTMEKYFTGNLSKIRLINRLVARRSTSAAPYGAYRTRGWCGSIAR